jgi:hypothetical protein
MIERRDGFKHKLRGIIDMIQSRRNIQFVCSFLYYKNQEGEVEGSIYVITQKIIYYICVENNIFTTKIVYRFKEGISSYVDDKEYINYLIFYSYFSAKKKEGYFFDLPSHQIDFDWFYYYYYATNKIQQVKGIREFIDLYEKIEGEHIMLNENIE